MSLELDEHREYLRDRRRIDVLARGVAAAVRPGDVVVDLGSGTGILALMACRAGAARVYAIEVGAVAEIAERLARENGLADRVKIVRGHSLDVTLPECADVLVSDQLGWFGFDAGLLEFYEDARRRFLKPGGRLMPRELSLWVAPVEDHELFCAASFWSSDPGGFTMRAAQHAAWNSGYPRHLEAAHLLSDGQKVARLVPGEVCPSFIMSAEALIARRGTLHGVAGWFSADLGDAATLTNAPGDPARIQRRNALFPISEPLAVQPGDRVRTQMIVRPGDGLIKWTIERCAGSEVTHRFEGSTFDGMLISTDAVRRTRPSFVPTLTAHGRARRLVLELADGQRTVGDIERVLFERHRPLFNGPADAGRLVAEVITRYAE